MPSGNGDDRAIQSFLFGGLNSTESALSVPYPDSPVLYNAEVDDRGTVSRRKGTRVIHKASASAGVSLVAHATGLGYSFLVSKEGTSLNAYIVDNDVSTLVVSKPNVWDSKAAALRAYTVQTGDADSRVIMLTGANKPVQLSFVEQQTAYTAAAQTSVTLNNASRYANAAANSLVVFVNRVLVTSFGSSYNAGTQQLTLSGLPASVSGNEVVDVIHITWQWWAEAIHYYGSQFFQSPNRYNISKSDQTVPIPSDLRSDILAPTTNDPKYPVRAYKSTAYGDAYTLSTNKQPQTSDQYYWSNGQRYDYAVTKFVTPSPLFVTFGTINTVTDPVPVHFSRRRELRFNYLSGAGGLGRITGQQLQVYVNGILQQANYNTAAASGFYADYYLYDANENVITSNTAQASFIAFEASNPIGVGFNSTVELVNTEVKHIGSGAISTRLKYKDGSWVPAYGLGFFADYFNGYYPRVGSLYQGRLALGGFVHNSLVAVVSGTYDAVVPGAFFSYFQVDEAATKDDSPFDIVVGSTPNDIVVSMIEWQRTLFIMTRKAVWRLYGDGGVLTPTSRSLNFLSSIGALNQHCVVRTELGVMYLSDSGLYDLMPTVENGEYQIRERSVKVREKFKPLVKPAKEQLPWMTYDSENRWVYIGMPDEKDVDTTHRIYVFNTKRESWTEYRTDGGFQGYSATYYTDRTLGNLTGLACVTIRTGATPANLVFIRFGYDRYIDYAERFVATATGDTTFTLVSTRPIITHTTAAGIREYPVTFDKTGQYSGYEFLHLTNVGDLSVKLNGTLLNFGADINETGAQYIKLPNGNVYLLTDPGAGATLTIEHKLNSIDTNEELY